MVGARLVGAAVHHLEHRDSAGSHEPSDQSGGDSQEHDVEDAGVVPAHGGLGDLGVTGVRDESESAESELNKTDEQWRQELSDERYRVLRQAGTERAFTGEYWDNHRHGVYRCGGCGVELFTSATKFDSGKGWPSFYQPAPGDAVETSRDWKMLIPRTEVHCRRLRRPPGPRLQRRPPPDRQALLHQLVLTHLRP